MRGKRGYTNDRGIATTKTNMPGVQGGGEYNLEGD